MKIETYPWMNITRSELIHELQGVLGPQRFDHVLRVEATALDLAAVHQLSAADVLRVSAAALLHDYAKELPLREMQYLAQRYPSQIPDLAEAGGAIWHGLAAAEIARSRFACTDQSVLAAVADHTTGGLKMDVVSQIVFMADFIEPARDFEGVAAIRQLTREDLTRACLAQMTHTLTYLLTQQKPIFPWSIQVYNHCLAQTKF